MLTTATVSRPQWLFCFYIKVEDLLIFINRIKLIYSPQEKSAFMAQPSLVQVFGTGATQDSSSITIQKSALTSLTASGSNTAESLLVGILLMAQSYLSQTNFDANTDQSIYIASGFSSFTTRGIDNDPYRVDQLTINLAKLDTAATLDADDY